MKKIIIYFALILILVIIFFGALSTFGFIKPKVLGVTNVEVLEINKDSVSINVEVSLINEFFLDVDIKEIKIDILSENDTIGTVNSTIQINLPGNDTSKITLPAKFNTSKLAELLEKNEDTLKVKLKGLIIAKILFFNTDVEIEENLKIELKSSILKAIEKASNQEDTADKIIEIKSAKLIDVGLKYSKVLIEFKLKNPYDLPIKLVSYKSDIYINDNYSGNGNIKEEIELKSKGEISEGQFEFEVENLKGIKSIFRTIFTSKMTYKTIGNLHLNILGFNVKIPYSSTGDLIKL